MKDTTTKAVEYIKEALKLLPKDNRDYGYFTKFLAAYERANEILDKSVADDLTKEREAILYATAIKVAHQLSSILFRFNLLDEKTEKAYREFPLPEKAEEEYHAVADPRMEATKAAQEKVVAEQSKQAEIDVFVQVVNGRSEEEAREKIAAYRNAGGE